jgi:hypothetical protein
MATLPTINTSTTNTPPATPKGFVQLPVSIDPQHEQFHNEVIAISAIVKMAPYNADKTTKVTLTSLEIKPSGNTALAVNQAIIVNLSVDAIKIAINKQNY